MALARCVTCGRQQGLKRSYTHPHEQICLPANHVVLCGGDGCTRLAMIWLTDVLPGRTPRWERTDQVVGAALDASILSS
jgi:hypothetical protein